ncbi:MAG: chromosome segregation protein SMC [Acidobacteria bacterium]|nr:chromosome segregation protein SMC [Acidobacteriota bacterium]
MRLAQLEIDGFKSFPERSALIFDDGVTAIVGPNGCGKSNVIDAITWVLGEQSARSLRGERMEDVIFSGSDGRRPTAAAEVRIQLANVTAALAAAGSTPPTPRKTGNGHSLAGFELDFEEEEGPFITRDVEVGRRLYRSGESEYLIDGRVCRLRDVQDLLMDSGVGVKAYSVIEQGRIGQILGARPTERRQLLEEAAGVTKYKSRRRSAELKLEAAHQNLTRVDDIVFEVEKQRVTLKRQAAKARRYRRLREELRRWQKVSFARRSRTLQRAVDEASRRLEEATLQVEAAKARLAERENRREKLGLELVEAEQAATTVRETAHQRELAIDRRQHQIEFDGRRAAELETELADGKTALATLEERLGPVETELLTQRAARGRAVTDRDAALERLRDAEQALAQTQRTIDKHESDVEAARSEMFAAGSAATVLQNVVDQASAGYTRIAEALARLDAEGTDIASQTARATEQRTAADATVAEVQGRLDAARARCLEVDTALASARRRVDKASADQRVREREIAAVRARLESLVELDAARAGYGDGARAVLTGNGNIEHHGSVADHLEVAEAHERAVEASLAALLQFVIVPSREAALAGVALAESRQAGRCGFLIAGPVDADEPARPASECDEAASPAPPHSSLRPLTELVTVTGPGAPVVRRLLARRWLAASLEEATTAAACTGDPIVTPDGFVARGAERLEGGGPSGASNLLTARREIKELRGQLRTAGAALDRLAEELTASEADAVRLSEALTEAQADRHALEKEMVGCRMQVERLEDEQAQLATRQQVIDTDRRHVMEERSGLEGKESEARESIRRLQAEQQSADERFMAAQAGLLEARETMDALTGRATDEKAEHAALAERAEALVADVRRLEDRLQDLRQQIEARKAANVQAHDDRRRLLAGVRRAKDERDADVRALDDLRREIVRLDARTNDQHARIASCEEEVKQARSDLDAARATVSRLEVARATVDADVSHLAEACREALQAALPDVVAEVVRMEAEGPIEPDRALLRSVPTSSESGDDADGGEEDVPAGAAPGADAAGSAADGADADAAGLAADGADADAASPPADAIDADRMVDVLRDKIDRLGPVNMMAIDQFDELEERHAFLTGQRQDLLDSIEATGAAIARIDATTRERFREAFTAVNDYFQETFQTLFGGGRAGLVLLDETDLLESGIDIIAQPPGKRLQSIQLLSGGEKALTAMALMFAIFRYRPSPFCLLDEIDAPLDDANIGRFVEMLRGLLDRTQFVLVTHNRKTMEIADRLYGVTMEEPGVSKLISVKIP